MGHSVFYIWGKYVIKVSSLGGHFTIETILIALLPQEVFLQIIFFDCVVRLQQILRGPYLLGFNNTGKINFLMNIQTHTRENGSTFGISENDITYSLKQYYFNRITIIASSCFEVIWSQIFLCATRCTNSIIYNSHCSADTVQVNITLFNQYFMSLYIIFSGSTSELLGAKKEVCIN